MRLNVPGAPASSKVIDGGGPSSEAHVSRFAPNRAAAALPYPGESALAGPGTAAGALASNGLQLPGPSPSYPFFATAEYPARPEQKVGDGPYLVEAKTSDGAAQGTARSGYRQDDGSAGVFFASAVSSVEQTPDGIVAEAVSDSEGLTIGPLTIGQMKSVARTEVGPDGKLTRSSSMTLGGVRVADSAIALTPSGIVVGSEPLPASASDFVGTLNGLLAPSKMHVSLMPAKESSNGVVSPVFSITTPTPNPRGAGEGTWQIVFGMTASSVDARLASAADEDPPAFDEDSEIASPEPSAEAAAAAPSSSAAPDIAFGAGGRSVVTAGGDSTSRSATDWPSSGVASAAPAGSVAQDFDAPLSVEASGGDATATQEALGSPAGLQAVLPAAHNAAQVGDGFNAQPVYLLVGGLVLVGVLVNALVGGLKGRWNS